MKECKRCINNETVKNITFDEEGICNFCNSYKEIEKQVTDYDHLEKLFLERIENVRGKYDYDAVVGISGGKDSVFVLYELIHKYKLKVKAFTMNNGFLSDLAIENIDKIVKEFGVEHEYINYDDEMLKRFYQYTMKKWLVPCIACSYIGYASMISYASKVNAGMCIHGRGTDQMFRLYDHDVYSTLVKAGLKSIKDIDIKELYLDLLDISNQKLNKKLVEDMEKMLFKDVKDNDFREFVAYFLYHKYNEEEIVDFLKNNTPWEIKEGVKYNHYDCKINNAAKYIYQCAEGRPHDLPEVSVLVRSGVKTKEEARIKLEGLRIKEKPKEELDLLFNFVGLKKQPILLKARLYKMLS